MFSVETAIIHDLEDGNLCVPISSWQQSKSLSDIFRWLLLDEGLE